MSSPASYTYSRSILLLDSEFFSQPAQWFHRALLNNWWSINPENDNFE